MKKEDLSDKNKNKLIDVFNCIDLRIKYMAIWRRIKEDNK